MDDAIDRLLKKKSLTEKPKIIIVHDSNDDHIGILEVFFIGFVPSGEALAPFNRFLEIEGFNPLSGDNSSKALTIPSQGWTTQEIALALKEVWEGQGFEVEVKVR